MLEDIFRTVIQPSLHTIPEYADMVIDEAEERGIAVDDLRRMMSVELRGEEDYNMVIDEAIDRLFDAGYSVVEENDTLLID